MVEDIGFTAVLCFLAVYLVIAVLTDLFSMHLKDRCEKQYNVYSCVWVLVPEEVVEDN